MSDLEILLCGPPEIRKNQQSIEIPRRLLRALLYYLASQGSMVSRDQLLLLWEKEPEIKARRRLNDSLSRLRASLPDPQLVHSSTALVGLDFNRVHVDQLAYQELIERAGRIPWQIPTDHPLPDHIYRYLRQAISLWRGTHFLAGANLPKSQMLDDWLTHTSHRLELQNAQIIDRLAHHARAVGNLTEALELILLLQRNDATHEELNLRTLQLYIELGLHQQAVEHYERVCTILQEELGEKPPESLTALYRQIRAGSQQTHDRPDPEAPWRLRPTLSVPFVGRRHIMDQLHRALNHGGGIIITGESGQGKSRLLKEFSTRIIPAPRLMIANCRPAENSLPFQPIIELLRGHVTPEEWLALPAVWASQLTRLLPDLAEIRQDLEEPVLNPGPELSPERARAALMEAIRQLFVHIARQRRLIICLDDIQWSDEASLATISYLIERPPFDRNALFLSAARLEESTPQLDTLLNSVQLSARSAIIPLARLSDGEISELIVHLTGQTPSFEVIRQLSQDTGGNPFFLLESIHALMNASTTIDLSQITSLPVTESIQNLVKTRLDRLPSEVRAIIEAAAILGTDFDPELLIKISQQSELQVANALEVLEKRGLITVIDHRPDHLRYNFSHDKIREILLRAMNPLRARFLHHSAAQELAQRVGNEDQAAIIANHYELGGELPLSFNFWILAIHRAHRLIASADAHWVFTRAEGLIARTAALSDTQIVNLYIERTEIAYENEDVLTIQKINTDLLRLGRERNSPLLIGTALDGLSEACMVSNQYEEGLAYTNESLLYLERGGSTPFWMQAYNHRGTFLYMLNRFDEAVESFQDALTIGAGVHDPKVIQARANAHYHIAITNLIGGRLEVSRNHSSRSLHDFTQINHLHGQITAYSASALTHYFLGDYQHALSDSQTGLDLASHAHSWRMLGYLHAYRGMIELAVGNIDECTEHARQAIAIGTRYRHSEIVSTGLRLQGDVFHWLQAPELCLSYYTQAVEANQDKFLAIDAQFRLISAMHLSGKDNQGRIRIQEMIQRMQLSGTGVFLMMARLSQVTMGAQEQDWKAVHELGRNLQEDAEKMAMKSIRLSAANLLAQMHIALGQISDGLDLARRTAQEAIQMPHPWIEISARVMVCQALSTLNQTDRLQVQRVHDLLADLRTRTTEQPFLQAFNAYCQRIEALV